MRIWRLGSIKGTRVLLAATVLIMPSSRNYAVALLALAALHITAAPLWDDKDPEQILFIVSRCMEEWSRLASEPQTALKNWMNWKLEPANDPATQCYTTCVLENIGFYEPAEKRFKGVRVMQQWEVHHRLMTADRESVHRLTDAFDMVPTLKSSKCSDVFNAYQYIHANNLGTIRSILFCDGKSAENYYKEKGAKIKQKGQSLFEFCENINYPIGSPQRSQLCKIRKYELVEGEIFDKHMECVFKGLRYMTTKNELDVEEIARDFRQVGKPLHEVKAVLRKCKSEITEKDPGKLAVHYYKCLLNDPKVATDFKEAFDYREIRSKDYMAQLKGELKPYERSDVRKQVDDIDNKQCG
ncbi:37 kDa salivary gland allergen Aed a 2-like [Armigeres subalbatus]|uniref:37 kDa salivary gland allergen Aed a 2-like n=1 Tax=Armigeres subalbatus TaxID=124917 RepID=UPI002ED18EC9